MSDKKRRDITLGEMQDECLRVDRKCEKCNKDISAACDLMINSEARFQEPCVWDLTDPPRFTEAQMDLRQSIRPQEIIARRPDGVADELGVATFRP